MKGIIQGNRITGSQRLEDAIDFNVATLRAQGFENVHTEDVPNLPNWQRGTEMVELLGRTKSLSSYQKFGTSVEPRRYSMAVSTVGLTVGGNVTADAIVVRSFEELQNMSAEGLVK